MVDDFFDVFLNLVYQYFVEYLSIFASVFMERDCLQFSFLVASLCAL